MGLGIPLPQLPQARDCHLGQAEGTADLRICQIQKKSIGPLATSCNTTLIRIIQDLFGDFKANLRIICKICKVKCKGHFEQWNFPKLLSRLWASALHLCPDFSATMECFLAAVCERFDAFEIVGMHWKMKKIVRITLGSSLVQ